MFETPEGSPFGPSYLKLRRALNHLTELKDLFAKFFADNDPEWKVEVRPLSGGKAIEFAGRTFTGPEEASAIVGDIVHNLRVALDLMATRLAELESGEGSNVYFPFADSKEGLETQIKGKNFHVAGEEAVRLLKTLEPYRGGNTALRALHDLDIQDKHKALILQDISWITPSVRIENGKPVTIPGDKGSAAFVFPADSHFAGDEIIPTLHHLGEMVHGMIESFAALRA